MSKNTAIARISRLNNIFAEYKIKASCVEYKKINHFHIYDIDLLAGCKINSLEKISEEIQLRMESYSKPNFSINGGKIRMVIADKPSKIELVQLLNNKNKYKTTEMVLGVDVDGNTVVADLEKMPHCIVAGSTNSGKSVFLHTVIKNFLLTYRDNVALLLCDPKRVEFAAYKELCDTNEYGVLVDVDNTYEEIITKLDMLVNIMEERFMTFAKNGCKNITEYNAKNNGKFCYILCIVDEFYDLITKNNNKVFEELICRLASKCRAAGIHIILATQRPCTKAINGNIKANFATRVCFKTSSRVDSLIVLDSIGGESLVGSGDCLMSYDGKMIRFQSAFV